MTATSAPHPFWAPAMTMRASRGSMGSAAIRLPVSVTVSAPSFPVRRALSSSSSSRPSRTARGSGGVRNGKSVTSCWVRAKPSVTIWRMTLARLVLRISGSVNSGRFSKSACEYRRMQMPSLVRPERPLRWFALAWLMGSMGRRCTFVRFE